MLKIEEGKFYKTRDGRKVGPMGKSYPSSTSDRMLVDCLAFPSRGIWWADGRGSTAYDTPEDLIAEWTDGPVVTETVTKTRIVPGVYGRIKVTGSGDQGVIKKNWVRWHPEGHDDWSADGLDAAAAVLSALAKGLRDA